MIRIFLQKKLWRDKMIDAMETKHGSKINWRHLTDHEFNEQLRIKLLEEVEEVCASKNKSELSEELADLYEVIDSLMKVNGITKDEVAEKQAKKRLERGGFDGRKYVETAQHPVGSLGEKYCLADPQKYPGIIG